MTDSAESEKRLETTWRSFGSASAAGAGALVALISLLADVPLATACLRGALTLFGVQLITRLGAQALRRTSSEQPPAPVSSSADSPTQQEQRAA